MTRRNLVTCHHPTADARRRRSLVRTATLAIAALLGAIGGGQGAASASSAPALRAAKASSKLSLKPAVQFGCAKPVASPSMAIMPPTGGATVAVIFAPFAAEATGCVPITVRTGQIPVTAGAPKTAARSSAVGGMFADTSQLAAAASSSGPLLSVTVGDAFPSSLVSQLTGTRTVMSGLQIATAAGLPNGQYFAAIRRHNVPNDIEIIEMTAFDGTLTINPRRGANGLPAPFELVVPAGATFAVYRPGTRIQQVLPPDVDNLPKPDARRPPKPLDPFPPHDFPLPGAFGRPAPNVPVVGQSTFKGFNCTPDQAIFCDTVNDVLSNGPGAPAVPAPTQWAPGGILTVQLNIGYMGLRQVRVSDCPPEWNVTADAGGRANFTLGPTTYKTTTREGCMVIFSTCPKKGGGTCYAKELAFR